MKTSLLENESQIIEIVRDYCDDNGVTFIGTISGTMILDILGNQVVGPIPRNVNTAFEKVSALVSKSKARYRRQRLHSGSTSCLDLSRLIRPNDILSWEQWFKKRQESGIDAQ